MSSFIARVTNNISLAKPLVVTRACPFDICVIILDGRPLSWCVIMTASVSTVFQSRAEWSIGKSGVIAVRLKVFSKSVVVVVV